MATFNQQNQQVWGNQTNAETVYVNQAGLIDKIDGLIVQAARVDNRDTAVPVLAYLRQARAVSAKGDEPATVALLRRAAEVATPIAAIATSITAVIRSVQ